MRTSIVVALVAALGCSGQVYAADGDHKKVVRHHHPRGYPVVNEVAAPSQTQYLRIPQHPVVRDCVHVMFPQCDRGFDGLNDGQFPLGR